MGETPPFLKMRECKEAEAEMAASWRKLLTVVLDFVKPANKERLALLNFII